MNEPTNILAFPTASPVDDRSAPIVLALLDPPDAPVVTRSSPYVMSLDGFARAFGGSSRRRHLLTALRRELRFLAEQGINPLCLLAGGGFVRRGDNPGDLDALVVYGLDPAVGVDAAGLLRDRPRSDLDLRFVPGDVGPVPLLKMGCFFHTLYQSRNRDGAQASVIVTLERGQVY